MIISKKDLAIVGIFGNVFEWYEFGVYSYLAPIFAINFFQQGNIKLNIIKAFFVFTLSYFIRPIGSLYFGYIGDRYGPANAYKISLLLMSITAILLGLLPTFHSIGAMATLLLIALRLIQGFSTGGELPGSLVFIYNHVEPAKRRFYCSLISGSTLLGILIASLAASLLHHFLTDDAILDWGWRIPFLLSIIIFPLLRSVVFKRLKAFPLGNDEHHGLFRHLGMLFRLHLKPLLKIIGLNAYVATVFYLVYIWMPSYLSIYLHVDPSWATSLTAISLALLICLTVSFSHLSIHTDYRKMMLASAIGMILLALPLFLLMSKGSLLLILLALVCLTILLSLMNCVFMVTLAGLFPTHIRTLGVGFGYTISASIFGGLTPTLCSWLLYRYDILYLPALILILLSIVVIPIISVLPKDKTA